MLPSTASLETDLSSTNQKTNQPPNQNQLNQMKPKQTKPKQNHTKPTMKPAALQYLVWPSSTDTRMSERE